MEAVSAIGGAVLSSAFQGILDRLTSSHLLDYAREMDVLSELKKWEKMLKKLYAVLDDAEEKQWANPLVKMWVTDLRDLAYDVEDVLDDLATEAHRRKLRAEPLARGSKVQKIVATVSASMNLNSVKFNAEMLSKIEEISRRIEEIKKERDELYLGEGVRRGKNRVRVRLPTTSLVDEAKVYGRMKDKEAIIEKLNAVATYTDVSVVPIVGMGGVGKTTLAQLIFNDANLEFDLKSWLCVGEDFDVVRMTKTILEQEGFNDKDLNLLQLKLKQKLSKKKYLIVLDDVWTESYEDWTCFSAPFVGGAPGSTFIITTRSWHVSSMMGPVETYFLRELSGDDCMSVFAQHALGATSFDEHMDLEEIGKEIVRRCQGLPLAAKAIGGLLRGSPNRCLWEQLLNNNIWDLPDDKSNILPALRLSYLHLPSHLKQCFAYCAIFPKNYEFDRNELVLLWMAEGFLHQPKKMKQMQDLGRQYFDDLFSRTFFQRSSSNMSLYVMHDLMSDLARYASGEICFQLGDNIEANLCAKIRHSSFTRHIYDISQRFEAFYEMKCLRTFLALPVLSEFCCNYLSSKVLHDLVPKLKCLRVLSLASYQCMELPNSVGALKHLRYLNLSYSEIGKLPESVGELFNLQTLRLRLCKKLTELPVSIGNLVNLHFLDIRGTDNLQQLPQEIRNLKNLQMLSKFIVGKDNGLKITLLKEFSHLQGFLHITGLQNMVDVCDADFVNLKEKRCIEELELEWADDSNSSRNLRNELQVLNSLRPHRNLSILSIVSFGGKDFPLWVGDPSFTNMVQIKLWNCRNITSLPPLGQLPSLRELSIGGMDGVTELDVEFYGDGSSSVDAFVCLETLEIQNMLMWELWSWPNGRNEEVATHFRNLRKLTICNCPRLVGRLPSFLPCLEKLEIQNCPKLVESPKSCPYLHELHLSECPEAVLKNFSDITTLSTLTIMRIVGLVNLQEVLTQALVSLKYVEIVCCEELKYLWQDGSNRDKLACLKHLIVYGCEQLVTLIKGEEGLLPCSLESLGVFYCENLERLPNGLCILTSLRGLTIHGCPKLMFFPAAGLPYRLKYLDIRSCASLRSLPKGVMLAANDSNETSQLENLHVEECPIQCFSVGELPPSLKIVTICHCMDNLLDSSWKLLYLTVLTIWDCPMLESFPEKGLQIPSLISLTISRCHHLRSLPSQMSNLISLCNLEINGCCSLVSLPPDGLPPNLTTLKIRSCENFEQPMKEWGLHRLSSLTRLEIEGTSPSTDMVSFPDDDGLLLPPSINFLYIIGLKNLKSISRGLQQLTSLKDLLILSCPKLQSLPMEGLPTTLGFLVIQSCPLLNERLSKEKGEYWPIIAHIPCVKMDFTVNE